MAANRTQLQNALHKPYDRLLFSREVLSPVFGSGFSMFSSPIPATVLPNKSESAVIDQVGIYGKIRLDDSTEITCYEVSLQPNVRIEQSKVAIQQYVRKLLTAGQAALINFVSPSTKNVWRLTLVAKDSVLTESGVKEKTTNAKRYTFLLGPSETCKTAAERFERLSVEKEIGLQTLIDAFSVEKLSDEFFKEYTLHYQNFCDYLQESNYRKSVFNIAFPADASKEEKDKASKPIRDFVKKLLGRIVFLYFVQKKGWLGASDTDYTDGPGDFIRQLFDESGGNETFYCNWLTVLFFDTLNKQRTNDDFILPDGKRVKVPFLNGGLFDMEEFDDQFLTFPAALFHNPDFEDTILTEKNKVHARGFLDFLDAFNFTVYEDSPDDHTVAVDPEMLGHIFENLLEDNKDKGAFYTPKEIVHYMCQESLIEYLATGLQNDYIVYKELGNEQIELFGNEFRKGQLSLIEQLGEKGLDRDEVAYMVKQKDISKLTPKQLQSIDQLLDNVKICDPAIGSGAFPMGLLHEILSLKELIAYETGKAWNPAEVKLNIIQNSIYGVDIEKGAVDIARLRFWLSLVIDEEKPKPLPNLDYKIVVGDSLISKFDGEIVEIDWERKRSVGKADEYVKNVQRLLMEVAEKQKQYFNPNNKNKKQLQAEIRNLKIELLINQLSFNRLAYIEKTPQKGGFMPTAADIKFNTERELEIKKFDRLIAKLQHLLQHPDEPFNHFDWKLDFPEVLNPYLVSDESRRGFDIVIGNPPYIKEYTNRNAFDGFRHSPYYQGKMDIWYGFACKMLDLLKPKGIECFIAQNNWITSAGASVLRNKVLSESEIRLFTDFGNYKVFKTAGIQTMIYILQKSTPHPEYDIKYSVLRNDKISTNQLVDFLDFTITNNFSEKFFFKLNPNTVKDKPFTFNNNISSNVLEKIMSKGNFYLTELEVANGIHPHFDFVNKKIVESSNGEFKNGEGIFCLSDLEKINLNLSIEEEKLVKPYYTTVELDRYYANPKNKLWIIYTGSEFKNPKSMEHYPNLKRHLDRFKDVITSDNKPYGLHRAREERFFKGESIIAQRKCPGRPSFTYTDFDCYVSATFYVIQTSRINMKYLTGLLNSKLIEYWLRNKGKMQGNNFQIDKEPLLAIPFIKPNEKITREIEKLVSSIIENKSENKDTADLEQQIDNLVYRLYELTYEEVKIIDPGFPLSKKEYENIQLDN
ncbi:MAG: N-6 DNA methylase [Bacteroidales bacterium]|nr:N-6 DNA methylase [Bacteroidales bacterium]